MPSPVYSNTDTKYHAQGDIKKNSVYCPLQASGTIALLGAIQGGVEVLAARAYPIASQAASGTTYYSLQLINGGTDCLGTAAVSSLLGGTAASGTAPGWTGGGAHSFAGITNAVLSSGQYVTLVVTKVGSPTMSGVNVEVETVYRDLS